MGIWSLWREKFSSAHILRVSHGGLSHYLHNSSPLPLGSRIAQPQWHLPFTASSPAACLVRAWQGAEEPREGGEEARGCQWLSAFLADSTPTSSSSPPARSHQPPNFPFPGLWGGSTPSRCPGRLVCSLGLPGHHARWPGRPSLRTQSLLSWRERNIGQGALGRTQGRIT